jgi:hypothetical protein
MTRPATEPRAPRLRHRATLLALALAVAGCAPGTGRNVAPTGAEAKVSPGKATPKVSSRPPAAVAAAAVRKADPLGPQQLAPVPVRAGALVPPPVVAYPAFVALSSPADLAGGVNFLSVSDAYFKDSAAALRLNALGPASHALVNVTTLGEDLYTNGGKVVTTTSKADGTFTLAKGIPTTKPFVVTAGFARGHRLAAIAPAGATSVEIDEATTMVTELARWQLFPFAVDDDRDVTDLTAGDLSSLVARTREILGDVALPSTGGANPTVEALRLGSGHVLRNAYVEAFGGQVTSTGGPTSTANTLSDLWEQALGFKPLALTRTAGNGIKGFNQSDGRVATQAEIAAPIDAVTDHLGNVFFSQYDVHLVSMVPIFGVSGPIYGEDETTLGAGNLHTIAGVVNGPKDPVAWELDAFRPIAEADPLGAVPMRPGGFPLYAPHKLAIERAGMTAASHVYFSQPYTGRIMLMPAADVEHFDHQGAPNAYTEGNLYSVAGRGLLLPWEDDDANGYHDANAANHWTPAADGEPATQAGLFFPTGFQRDTAGNLWILDAGDGSPGTGGVLVVNEADGLIFRVPLTRNGVPFTPDGALDLRLSPDESEIYVADTERHWVFKFPNPGAPPFTLLAPPPAQEITRVAGKPDVAPADPANDFWPGIAGFLDTSVADVLYPDIHDVSDGVDDPAGDLVGDGGAVARDAVTALLNRPGSICFDAVGDLLIGDTGNGRVRLKKDGKLYTIAGGLDTRYITGDSRLAYMPAIGYLNLTAEGNVLLTDKKEAVVRKLHTVRGSLVKP